METTMIHLFYFALLNLAIVLTGYPVIKKQMIWLSWMIMIISILSIHLIFLNEIPMIRMLAIIAVTFTTMKVIAVAESYKEKPLTLGFKQWFIFATGWAGMRAEPFETLGTAPLPGAWPMIRFGISRICGGLVLIAIAHLLAALPGNYWLIHVAVSVILLIGFSLILHFGLLSISAGTWRLKGANTYYLFREPAKATSLSSLWSKRWNLAFSEMTSVAIFRPLKDKTGNAGALMISFIFSGLLHELALSVPVNSGYGLPTLYFTIQGLLVLIEKFLMSRNTAFLKNKFTARLWLYFWLIVPMPLLFHPQFIKEIAWPLAGLKW